MTDEPVTVGKAAKGLGSCVVYWIVGLVLFALAWIVFVVGVDWLFGDIPPER